MQLASGFLQLAAAGRRRNIVHFHCIFEEKNVNSALQWGFHLGRYIVAVKLIFRPLSDNLPHQMKVLIQLSLNYNALANAI